MVMQIAFGIFFGFLFLAIFAGILLGISYFISKPPVPKFLEKPHKTNVQDWWDRYEEDDY